MNVIDWNKHGIVAVALSYTLYLWNSESGDIQELFQMDSRNELALPTAVKWSKDGLHLAVGFRDGTVKIYDPKRVAPPNGKLEIRTMKIPQQSRNGWCCFRFESETRVEIAVKNSFYDLALTIFRELALTKTGMLKKQRP